MLVCTLSLQSITTYCTISSDDYCGIVMIAVTVYCPQSYETTETYVLVSQTGEGDCQPHLFSVTASNDAGTSPASTVMESIPICESCPVCEQLHTYIHSYIHTYIHSYIHTYIHYMIYIEYSMASSLLSPQLWTLVQLPALKWWTSCCWLVALQTSLYLLR